MRSWTPGAIPGGGAQPGRGDRDVDGIPAGLVLVDHLAASGSLDGYHLSPATRADLLRRDGRREDARVAYEEALRLAPTEAERRYLTGRIRDL